MKRYLFALFLTALTSGCIGPKVSHTADSSFNFATVETYQIVPDASGKASVKIHPQVRQQIDRAINDRMQKLGYMKGYPQAPNMVVSYRLESIWDPRLSPEEIRQRLGFTGSRFPDADPRARDYQILTLVLEIGSPADKKVLWKGQAEGVHYEVGRSGWEIVHAAEAVMKDFRP